MDEKKLDYLCRTTLISTAVAAGAAFLLQVITRLVLANNAAIEFGDFSLFDFMQSVLMMAVLGAICGALVGLFTNPPKVETKKDSSEETLAKLGLPSEKAEEKKP